MRRLALAQLGSKGVIDDVEFAKQVSLLVIRVNVPLALRAAANLFDDTHKAALLSAATECEKNPSESAARSAAESAAESARSAAWSAAWSAWSAARSAELAAESAAESAARSAESAARSAAWSAAARAAARSAESSAWSAESSAWPARDEILSAFAEGVVQILVDMKAPGCEWLSLTEVV
jgi:hypothetical protein